MHLLPPAPTGFKHHAELVFPTGAASPSSPPSKGHEALLWSSIPKAFQDLRLKATPLLHLTQPLPSQTTPNFTAVYLQPTCVQSLGMHSLLHQTNTTKHVWHTQQAGNTGQKTQTSGGKNHFSTMAAAQKSQCKESQVSLFNDTILKVPCL